MLILLVLIFTALTALSIKFFIDEYKDKKANKGYLLTTAMIAAGDLLCVLYVCIRSFTASGVILLIYYLLHAWLLPAILYFVYSIEKISLDSKNKDTGVKPAIFVSILQTLLVVAGFKWEEIFGFKNKLFISKTWVVAMNPENAGYMPDYGVYTILLFANVLIVIFAIGRFWSKGPRIFRSRYIIFLVIVSAFALIEIITYAATLPVWIQSIPYNAIYILGYYMMGDYATRRIRDWSLDNFADNMSDGLILYDRDDNPIHINAMIRRSIHTELLRQFSDRSKLDEWLNNTTEMESSQVLKYEGPDRVYYFKPHVQELTDNDIRIGTLYILHDHSDSYNRIKAMRKSNEELEKAGRMKSDFLANMSHEIRTPMNAVIGMAELAMREGDPERVNDYLRQIRSSGKNLLNIINDILDYSKIESGKMEIIEDKYSPAEELSDVANVLSVRIGDKPVELFVAVDGVLPRMLIGDSMRIRQILINLANNAIKFTNEGFVKINISSKKLNDDYMEFTFHVIDTGIGIKEEDKNKLFESFQQVDSKRNRSVEGTGLGLAISKRLVSAMGGTIGIESEYGQGSDFWFTVPQKVADDSNEILVENSADKLAYVLAGTGATGEFLEEMKRLGMHGEILDSLDEYRPSDTIDFLFVDPDSCDERMRAFLKEFTDVRGIVITDPDNDMDEELPNLHVMRGPKTTVNMVRILNERYDENIHSDESNLFEVDFCAPDAKVLVADDNDINLTIAGGLLASMDIVPEYAHGGIEAVEMSVANDYDIVFMDHMMPEVDGVEATIAIRKELNSMIHPVIIALSANVMEEARKLFKSSGMNDFVGKPIDLKDLAEKVKKWLPEEKIKPKAAGSGSVAGEGGFDASVIDYDDLDPETALKALGSAALYEKILEEYYRSGEDKYAGIKQSYDNEDWENYTIRVHALKSSSRQVGALKLGNMAEELEKAGKASDIDTIKSRTDDTLKEYNAFLTALGAYYGAAGDTDDGADKPPVDADTLRDLADQLTEACDDLDMDRMESVSESLQGYAYEDDMRPLVDDLVKAISSMDTDKCMELIGLVRKTGNL